MSKRITRRRAVSLEIAGSVQQLNAPGLKIMRRGGKLQLYWVKDDHAEYRFYKPKTVPIHVDLSNPDARETIEQICQREQQAMLDSGEAAASDRDRLAPYYRGTIASLIDLYEHDKDSAFNEIKENSKESYRAWLKVVRDSIGARRLDRISAKHFRGYYWSWRKPAQAGGGDRVRRAYGCIQIMRAILSYGIEADFPDCDRLRKGLSQMRFAKNPPREETLMYAHAAAIVDICITAGDESMAMTQALEWDCGLRQIDVVGQWRLEPDSYVLKAGEIRRGSKVWSGMTIDLVRLDRDLIVRTSKTGQPVIHAIDKCELVARCLPYLDRSNPMRPVAVQLNGKPWADRQAFSKAWRKYATQAGVPKSVWNMDNRASAITEGAAGNVSDDDLASTGGHAGKGITRRVYKRKARQISERFQAARQASRREQRKQ